MPRSSDRPPAPELTGSARDAVRYRGGHLQIIAAAGSGKTEVVSQRVVDLLAEGVPAESIVAFTFTERAAEELGNRIAHRVEDRLGVAALDRLAELFVGTIHAFCFRLLQQRVPRYETYDVLDDNQLTAFLSREANRLGVRQLDQNNRLFASIATFLKSVDVVENELLDPATMPDPFGICAARLLRGARPLPAAYLRPAGGAGGAGTGAPGAGRRDSRPAASPHRRRVPGRQSGAGATDRAADRARRWICVSWGTTSRPFTSGAARTFPKLSRSLTGTGRGNVRDHDEPAEPTADDRGRESASPGPSRSGSRRR